MKWDVKHDRAKRVIDACLENAGDWKEREDLAAGLTDEEKTLVNEEVALMIASIRKRYKLQERLPEAVASPAIEKAAEQDPEVKQAVEESKIDEAAEIVKEPEKPKKGKKASTGEKKATTRKSRTRKIEKEVKQDEKI